MSTSISVSRRCQTLCRDRKRKLRRRSEQYEDLRLEGRVYCTVYQVAEEANRMKKLVIIFYHDRINIVPIIKARES
jgi:hypothetical protein